MRRAALVLLVVTACGRTTTYRPKDGLPPFDAGMKDAGIDAGAPDAGRPTPVEPCIITPQPGIAWEFQQAHEVVCFGMAFTQHGQKEEYAFASIPAEDDRFWAPMPFPDISFDDPSRLCNPDGGDVPICACNAGGDFTYFQTRAEILVQPKTFSVTIQNVDDGVRVTLFNSKHPEGFIGGFAFFPSGATTDFAAETVVGHNRLVLTHVDDCCRERRIANAHVLLDGDPLVVCP